MRDPWKLLSLLLALVLGLVVLLRSPAQPGAVKAAAPAETAGSAADASAADLQDLPGSGPIRESARESSTTGDIALLVRLVHPDGSPSAAWMTFHPADGSRTWTRMTHGVGVLLGVRPGAAQIRINGRGYYSRAEDVLIAAAPAEQELRLIAEPSARIAVRFMAPDGRRLVEVLKERLPVQQAYEALPDLFAWRQGPLPQFPPKGEFPFQSSDAMWSTPQELVNLPDELDGELSLMSPPPMVLHALLRHRPIGMQTLEAPVETLDFVVDPERLMAELGSVRVQLRDDATGEPFARSVSNVSLEGASSARLVAEADDGLYRLDGLPPGSYILSAWAKDRASRRQSFILDPGAEFDAGEIRLQPPASLQLRILDPDGQPVPKVRVLALNLRVLPTLFRASQSYYESNAEGEVKIGGVEAVEHLFSLVPPPETKLGADYVRLTPSLVAGAPVEIRLKPGIPVTLSGQGEDFLQHSVRILVEGVARVPGVRFSYLPLTVYLAPGEHAWILVDPAGRELRRGAILIEEGMKELRVEVPLP